ncbi:MAG TPA: xanthine dehydrogenase family protein molybdopterin-binding subunit, partial [Kiloniellales bacterium]|nr:xanthine dehydrogenase family protein molybdopterin-binding subunit [Kiloniellales bacterium]
MGQFGVGQAVRRVEDERLLTGQGQYGDDVNRPGQAYGYVLRSPLAHALITRLDVAAARQAPGVLAVLTAMDLDAAGIGSIPCVAPMKGRNGSPTIQPRYPILAGERCRHVGDAVAFVVADSLAAARDAAELIEVDYEPQAAVTSTAEALSEGAAQVHAEAPGNLCLDYVHGDEAKVAAAFTDAEHVARIEIVNNRIVVSSMEPRGALGEYDAATGQLTMTTGNQGIFRLRPQLAQVLGMPVEKLRLVSPDVGGGFGMKIFLYPEQVLVLHAARLIGRPVKWTSDRAEAFLSDTQGRDHVSTAELALDAEGRFLALRIATVANLGAYLSNFAPFVPTGASTGMMSGLYRIPAVFANVKCVFTHTVPVDAYRGAGRPEAAYIVERVVDEAARVMGVSPLEIRLRNLIRPQDLPYTSAMGPVYDSGDFPASLEKLKKLVGWDEFESFRAEMAAAERRVGIGLACYVEGTGVGPYEGAHIQVETTGKVKVAIGLTSQGQGHRTAFGQIVADELGVPFDDVEVVSGDTRRMPYAVGTFASRAAVMSGSAVALTARMVRAKAIRIAAEALEANEDDLEIVDGLVRVKGTPAVNISLGTIAVLSNPLRYAFDEASKAATQFTVGDPGKPPVAEDDEPGL